MEQNKNRLEVRLDPETTKLLNSLLARTKLTKTSLIKNCLKVYASCLTNGHILTIRYNSVKSTIKNSCIQNDSEEDPRTMNEIIEDLDK